MNGSCQHMSTAQQFCPEYPTQLAGRSSCQDSWSGLRTCFKETLQCARSLTGGISLTKPECTGCRQSSQTAGKEPQTPDIKMLISWSTSSQAAAPAGSARESPAWRSSPGTAAQSAEHGGPGVCSADSKPARNMGFSESVSKMKHFWDSLTFYTVYMRLCKKGILENKKFALIHTSRSYCCRSYGDPS